MTEQVELTTKEEQDLAVFYLRVLENISKGRDYVNLHSRWDSERHAAMCEHIEAIPELKAAAEKEMVARLEYQKVHERYLPELTKRLREVDRRYEKIRGLLYARGIAEFLTRWIVAFGGGQDDGD